MRHRHVRGFIRLRSVYDGACGQFRQHRRREYTNCVPARKLSIPHGFVHMHARTRRTIQHGNRCVFLVRCTLVRNRLVSGPTRPDVLQTRASWQLREPHRRDEREQLCGGHFSSGLRTILVYASQRWQLCQQPWSDIGATLCAWCLSKQHGAVRVRERAKWKFCFGKRSNRPRDLRSRKFSGCRGSIELYACPGRTFRRWSGCNHLSTVRRGQLPELGGPIVLRARTGRKFRRPNGRGNRNTVRGRHVSRYRRPSGVLTRRCGQLREHDRCQREYAVRNRYVPIGDGPGHLHSGLCGHFCFSNRSNCLAALHCGHLSGRDGSVGLSTGSGRQLCHERRRHGVRVVRARNIPSLVGPDNMQPSAIGKLHQRQRFECCDPVCSRHISARRWAICVSSGRFGRIRQCRRGHFKYAMRDRQLSIA